MITGSNIVSQPVFMVFVFSFPLVFLNFVRRFFFNLVLASKRGCLIRSLCLFPVVTPPKTVLPPEQTLVGAGCVPCTLVHFAYSSGTYDKYLRDDVAVQITSPRGAAIAARQSR